MASRPRRAGDAERERAQREARAHRAGFDTFQQYRNAQARERGYRNLADQRRARGEGRPSPSDRAAAPASRRQVVHVGDTTTVTTTAGGRGYGVIESQARKAAGRGLTAYGRAVIRDPATGERRTIDLWRKGGWDPDALADALALGDAEAIADAIADGGGSPPIAGLAPADILSFSVTFA